MCFSVTMNIHLLQTSVWSDNHRITEFFNVNMQQQYKCCTCTFLSWCNVENETPLNNYYLKTTLTNILNAEEKQLEAASSKRRVRQCVCCAPHTADSGKCSSRANKFWVCFCSCLEESWLQAAPQRVWGGVWEGGWIALPKYQRDGWPQGGSCFNISEAESFLPDFSSLKNCMLGLLAKICLAYKDVIYTCLFRNCGSVEAASLWLGARKVGGPWHVHFMPVLAWDCWGTQYPWLQRAVRHQRLLRPTSLGSPPICCWKSCNSGEVFKVRLPEHRLQS